MKIILFYTTFFFLSISFSFQQQDESLLNQLLNEQYDSSLKQLNFQFNSLKILNQYDLINFFTLLNQNKTSLSLNNTSCKKDVDEYQQEYLECKGFHDSKSKVTLAIVKLFNNLYAGYYELEMHNSSSLFPFSNNPFWMNQLDSSQAHYSLKAGSREFTFASTFVQESVQINVKDIQLNQSSSSSFFGLETCLLKQTTSNYYTLKSIFKFQDHFTSLNYPLASITLKGNDEIKFKKYMKNIFLRHLQIHLIGFFMEEKNVQVDIEMEMEITFPQQTKKIFYLVKSPWKQSQSKSDSILRLLGKTVQLKDETKIMDGPFNAKWWNFDGSEAILSLMCQDQLNFVSIYFRGFSTLNIMGMKFRPNLSGYITNDGEEFFVGMDIPVAGPRQPGLINNLLTTMTNGQVVAGADEMSSAGSSCYVVVTNTKTSTNDAFGSPSLKEGVNIFTDIKIFSNTKTHKLLKPLLGDNEKNTTFRLGLQYDLNDFSTDSTLERAYYSLQVADIHLDENKKFKNTTFVMNMHDLLSTSIQAFSSLIWSPNGGPLGLFLINSEWKSSDEQVNLNGKLGSEWDKPFNLPWVKLMSASMNLKIFVGQTIVYDKWDIRGKAQILWAKNPSAEFDIVFQDSQYSNGYFVQTSLKIGKDQPADIVDNIIRNSFKSELFSTQTSPDVTNLKALRFQVADLKVTYATHFHKINEIYYEPGITLESIVVVNSKTPLFNRLKMFHSNNSLHEFSFKILIPKEITQDGITFTMRTPEHKISELVRLNGIQFEVTVGMPLAIGISSGIGIKFNSNPEYVNYVAGGEINSLGHLKLAGGQWGRWENVFGLNGFDMIQSFLSIGLAPYPPFVVSFGLGGSMAIGETIVACTGYVDLSKPTDIFFKSQIQEISFREVVRAFNKMKQGAQRIIYRPNVLSAKRYEATFGVPKEKLKLTSHQEIIFNEFESMYMLPNGSYAVLENNTLTKIFPLVDHTYNFYPNLRSGSIRMEDQAPINESRIPEVLRLKHLQVDFAPYHALLEVDEMQIKFDGGLYIKANTVFLGIEESSFALRTIFIPNSLPNFVGNFDLEFSTLLEKWLLFQRILFPNKELQPPESSRKAKLTEYIERTSNWIPQITNIVLTDFDFFKWSRGQTSPLLQLEVLFRQKVHKLSSRISLFELVKGLGVVFRSDLIRWNDLLGFPQCLTSFQCPKGQHCLHSMGHPMDKRCVNDCATHQLGQVPIFGCVHCLSRLECRKSIKGSRCENFKCIL